MSLPSASTAKALHFTVTATEATDGQAAVTISTGNSDRHRDKVMPSGVNLANYRKNPVVLFGHNYDSIPVATCTSIESTAEGLKASWKWLQNDPMADRVKNAWDQGVLRAASIGFMPTKWSYDEERRGYDYLEAELLEFSIVAVPANAEAVRRLQALGVPVSESQAQIAELSGEIAGLKTALAELPEQIAALVKAQAPVIEPKAADPVIEPVVTVKAEDADDFFLLDDEQKSTDDEIDLADLPSAMQAALAEIVQASVETVMSRALGRVD